MNIRQLNPNSCWTYLIKKENSFEVALVDPVLEHVAMYLGLLEKEKLNLTQVLETHCHADHISASTVLKDHTDCEYLMHEKSLSGCVTSRLQDGQKIELGGLPATIMSTPGHTQDSISLVFSDRVLVGDTLFLEDAGAGRDDLPGGDPGEHWDSLQRLMGLPDELIVYPAHEYRGRKPSSLKNQKEKNPHLKLKSRDSFINYLTELKLGPADWMKDVLKANYSCARDPKAAWIPIDSAACEIKGTMDLGANEKIVENINPEELRALLNGDNRPILLDVREANELEGELGHLEGIVHVPVGELSKRLDELKDIREKKIITICKAGGRASTAAQILMQDGFKKVKVLDGGMTIWRQKYN